MKRLIVFGLLLNASLLVLAVYELAALAGEEPEATQNGDTNGDGYLDLADAVHLLRYFFHGGPAPVSFAGGPDHSEEIAGLQVDLAALRTEVASATAQLQAGIDANATGLVETNNRMDSAAADIAANTTAIEDLEASPAPAVEGFTFAGMNAQGHPEYTHDATGIRFVRLHGGSFNMGSPATETGRFSNEGPVHTVSLSPFLIAKTEVTQAQYEAVMGVNPSSLTGNDQRPVEGGSWDDLKDEDGFLARTGLFLPSEAQWEYACRAGQAGPYSGTANLDEMGWYSGNSESTTHPVGTKAANQFGLHDMHGNVEEWCEDVYDAAYYERDVPGFDPVSTSGSGNRVYRGGSWGSLARNCRSALRGGIRPDARLSDGGFRPLRPLP